MHSTVWLKMERYSQFLNIQHLLWLQFASPKDAIRISCRWISVVFCKMQSISSTWNHMPQPAHCMNRRCNRNQYKNNTQNHNQHQFLSLICAGCIHARQHYLTKNLPSRERGNKQRSSVTFQDHTKCHWQTREGAKVSRVLPNSTNFYLLRRNMSLFFLPDSKFALNSVLVEDEKNKAIDETELNLLSSICRKSGESFQNVKTVHFSIFLYKTFSYCFKIPFAQEIDLK